MMEQPNLIKRPILSGSTGDLRVQQGRSTSRLRNVMRERSIRIGTSGWNYPIRPRHLERHLLSRAGARASRPRQVRRARLLRRALRHGRGQLDLLRRAGGHDDARAGPNGRRRLRVLAEALSEVHAPGDVPQGHGAGSAATSASKDVDEFRRAIDPLATAGKLGALLAQFPASFKNDAGHARLPRVAARTLPRLSAWRWSCAIAAGATTRARRCRCSRRFGAAWTQIDEPKFRSSIRQNLPNVHALLLHAAARPQRRAVVEAREVRGPLQLSLLSRRAAARSPRPPTRRRAR